MAVVVDRVHIAIEKSPVGASDGMLQLDGEFARIPNVIGIEESYPFRPGYGDAKIPGSARP